MKVSWLAISAIAVSCIGTQARAQCPASVTNPVNLIAGTSWAFLTNDGLSGDATTGIFTAQIGTGRFAGEGVLSITETFNNAGVIERQVTGTGIYQVYPDCSGGTLTFKLGDNGYQYAFVLKPGGTEMYLASANVNVPNTGVGASEAGNRGIAKLLSGPPSCSATNPLSTFAGTWAFLTQDYESSSVGRFTAQVSSTTGLGVLNIVATTSGVGFISVQESETGKYQINADCSGGELYFQVGDNAYQYAFVFASPTEIFMVSDNANILSKTYGVLRGNFGTANRF